MKTVGEQLDDQIATMGLKDIKVFWNEEWLAKVRPLEGKAKQRETDKAKQVILNALRSIERGDFTPLDEAIDMEGL